MNEFLFFNIKKVIFKKVLFQKEISLPKNFDIPLEETLNYLKNLFIYMKSLKSFFYLTN